MKTLARQDVALFPSLPSLIDDFFNRDWMDSTLALRKYSATLPSVNVRETNEEYLIDVAAPGIKRDDFKVELENNVLKISAHCEQEHGQPDRNGMYTRREFNYQSFERSFTLPENKVQGEKISARYTDGILHISIPKKDEAKAKPVRQISVG